MENQDLTEEIGKSLVFVLVGLGQFFPVLVEKNKKTSVE